MIASHHNNGKNVRSIDRTERRSNVLDKAILGMIESGEWILLDLHTNAATTSRVLPRAKHVVGEETLESFGDHCFQKQFK